MIQPNELRIGNYVDYKGKMLPVLAIDNEAFLSELKYKGLVRLPDKLPNGMVFGSSGIWCAKINPIPITPEILERLGFEKHSHFTVANSRFIELGRNRVLSVQCAGTPNEIVFLSEQSDKAVKDVICIRNYDYDGYTYVHQLQNLYHSLTGIELTFKTN
jgi:hypothetical protein